MKRTFQLIVAATLLAPLILVFGDVKTFTWIPPTEYEDGSPLDNADIKEYQLHCNSGLDVIISNDPSTNTWISQDTDFPPGFYTCWMHTITLSDLHSEDSNNKEFVVQMQFEVRPKKKGSGCS